MTESLCKGLFYFGGLLVGVITAGREVHKVVGSAAVVHVFSLEAERGSMLSSKNIYISDDAFHEENTGGGLKSLYGHGVKSIIFRDLWECADPWADYQMAAGTTQRRLGEINFGNVSPYCDASAYRGVKGGRTAAIYQFQFDNWVLPDRYRASVESGSLYRHPGTLIGSQKPSGNYGLPEARAERKSSKESGRTSGKRGHLIPTQSFFFTSVFLFISGCGLVFGFYCALDRDRTIYACLCLIGAGTAFVLTWWLVILG